MSNLTKQIRRELKRNATAKNRKSGERFFKEKVKLYGVKTALVVRIGKHFFQEIKDRPKAEIFVFCEELWRSGYLEESFIAANWSYSIRKDYKPKDFKIFEKWVKIYVGNWASCDTFCNHALGAFLDRYPSYSMNLKKWAVAKNRWLRRAAAVSLIIPAKQGRFLKDIFEIADILLTDQDDLVQKGYGWLLKAASQAHEKEVFAYVMKNKKIMPRTALRYAIEKMPKELKAAAMAKK
jgi:3-methyladenine DNA glycosylase AlkD